MKGGETLQNCFLNCIFTDGENKVYEVVKFDDNIPLQSTIEYHNEDGLVELLEAKEYKFDFNVRNGFVLWGAESAMVQEKPEVLRELLSTKRIEYTTPIKTVYDLLYELIDLQAMYIDHSLVPDTVGNLGELTPNGNSVAHFKELKVSKGTMNVYFTILTDEGFRIRSIVAMNDGTLTFTGFCFAIPTNKYIPFPDDYPIDVLGRGTVNGRDMMVFRLNDGMSIYPIMIPQFKMYDPVLHHKIYTSERDKIAIDLLSYFVTMIMKAIFPEGSEDDESSTKEPYDTTHVTDRRHGVNFKLKQLKAPNLQERDEMMRFTIKVFEQAHAENLSLPQILALIKAKYNNVKEFACFSLLRALAATSTSPLDRVECVKSLREEFKANKLQLDLELFICRAYIYLSDYRLPFGADVYEMMGGNAPYISEISKKIKR